MNGLLEILTNKKWMIHPESLQALRMVIQQNLAGHIALEHFEKRQAYCMGMTTEGDSIRMAMPSERGEQEAEEQEVSYVSILPVCGPITRNGDACSYGSVDLRDAVMEISDEEECKGIVFYINSPGGSAAAIADYKYAINYARAKDKKCVAFVDGMCCSAAMYLAALCDERYYMNEQDMIGSIGVMAAFYTEKDGEKNQYTNETYHELYATESYEKNKWYRDAAEGDYKELIADLDKTCEEFMADVKAACPNATEEHLHGATFDAKEVDGILMDGQSTLDTIIGNIIALSGDQSLDTEQGCKPKKAQTQNNIDMTNYPLTLAALGVETLVVNEEGTFMNAALLDAMEAHLAQQKQALADFGVKLEEANKALAEAQAHSQEIEQHLATAQNDKEEAEKALASANENYTKQLTEATETYNKAIEEKASEIEALNAKLATVTEASAEVNKELEDAKASLATAEQALADKDAQILALTNAPAQTPDAGASAASNGNGAEAGHSVCCAPDPNDYANMADFNKAMAEFMSR